MARAEGECDGAGAVTAIQDLPSEIEAQVRAAAERLLAEVRARYSGNSGDALNEVRTYGRERIAHELATDPGEWRELYERALDDSRLPFRIAPGAVVAYERAADARAAELIERVKQCPGWRVYRKGGAAGSSPGVPDLRIVERDVLWPAQSHSRSLSMHFVAGQHFPYWDNGLFRDLFCGGRNVELSADDLWDPGADVVALEISALLGEAFSSLGALQTGTDALLARALQAVFGEERLRVMKEAHGTWGAFYRYAEARASLLPYPRRHFAKTCRYCGEEFDALRPEGLPTFCGRCLVVGYMKFGLLPRYREIGCERPGEAKGRPVLEEDLRAYTQALGCIPPPSFTDGVVSSRLEQTTGDARDELFAALISIEHPGVYSNVYGSWFKALVAAGVLEGAERRGFYGTTCLANDGHQCRSIAERTIDDWLTAHGLAHVREPHYPHPDGAEGEYLADWQVGEVLIEYLGLAGKPRYDRTVRIKRNLARQEGIPLICLYPRDVPNLDRALGMLLETGRR